MEDYKTILAISGKAGLYKLVGQMKNGIIAESLLEGKRFPIYMSENTSSLEDISIYTEEGELPLKDILKSIHSNLKGKNCDISLKDSKALNTFFEKIVPSYDKERVYTSDIKKVVKWYNNLLEAKLLILEEKKAPKKAADKKTATAKKTAPKKTTTKKPTTTKKATTTAKKAPVKRAATVKK